MARIETDPNYSSPTFSRATAGTDLFKKEDVQALAAAVSTHDHTAGKGAVLVAGSIPAGSITSGMIADATIDTADLKDGAVTSAKIADGTIATADHADASVTNAKLASDTARANLLTNGGFEVWQRGNGPFTTPGAFTADRWQTYAAGGPGISVLRDTTNQDSGSGACMAVTITNAGGAGNPASVLQYPLHPTDTNQARGRTISFSVRVACGVANGVRLQISATGMTAQYSPYHTGNSAYQTLTVSATLPSTLSGIGVTTQVLFEANGTTVIDNAMLVVGSVAADYAPLHPADDLARCERYYEILADAGAGNLQPNGYATAGGQYAQFSVPYRAVKPVSPTVTVVPTWTLSNATGPGAFGDKSIVLVRCTSVGAGQFYASNLGTSTVTIESNP